MDQSEHEAHHFGLHFDVQGHPLVDVRHSVAGHHVDCHIYQVYDHQPELGMALESSVRYVHEDRAWKFRIDGQEGCSTGALDRVPVHVSKQPCRDAEEYWTVVVASPYPSSVVLATLHPSDLDDARDRFYLKEVSLAYHRGEVVSYLLNWARHSDLRYHYVLVELAQWPSDLCPVVVVSHLVAHGHVGAGQRQSALVPYLEDLVDPHVQGSESPFHSRVVHGRWLVEVCGDQLLSALVLPVCWADYAGPVH